MDASRFERAIAAIDAANADDPNEIVVRGTRRSKELAHAELVTEWVRVLEPDASEPLLLAARAHHIRRWTLPRASHPAGRAGYLRWRRALHDLHASEVGRILTAVGYDDETIARVQAIVAKRDLAHDPEVQTLEDALCIVFVETQLPEMRDRLGHDKIVAVVRKTLAKMSPRAIEIAATRIDLADEDRGVLVEATRP